MKRIREALEFWAESCPEAPAGVDALAALEDVEAIEQMAKTIAGRKLDPDELRSAAELMQAIAKDAP